MLRSGGRNRTGGGSWRSRNSNGSTSATGAARPRLAAARRADRHREPPGSPRCEACGPARCPAAERAAASPHRPDPGCASCDHALGAYGVYSLVRGLFGGTLDEGRDNAAVVIDPEKTLGIYVEPDAPARLRLDSLGMPFWNGSTWPARSSCCRSRCSWSTATAARRTPSSATWRSSRGRPGLVGLRAAAGRAAAAARLGLHRHGQPARRSSTSTRSSSGPSTTRSRPCRACTSGMAPVVAWALIRLTPWVWTRALGWAYPVLVAVCIVVTGNHYVLDIAGGLAWCCRPPRIAAWIVRARPDARTAAGDARARPREPRRGPDIRPVNRGGAPGPPWGNETSTRPAQGGVPRDRPRRAPRGPGRSRPVARWARRPTRTTCSRRARCRRCRSAGTS